MGIFTNGKPTNYEGNPAPVGGLVVYPIIYREIYGNLRSYMISGWWFFALPL